MATNTPQIKLKTKKNFIIAYTLWLFLGFFGAHRFYIKKEKAVVMLISPIVSYIIYNSIFLGYTAIGLFTLDPTMLNLTGMLLVIIYVYILVVFVWWIIDGINLYKWVQQYNLQLINNSSKNKK